MIDPVQMAQKYLESQKPKPRKPDPLPAPDPETEETHEQPEEGTKDTKGTEPEPKPEPEPEEADDDGADDEDDPEPESLEDRQMNKMKEQLMRMQQDMAEMRGGLVEEVRKFKGEQYVKLIGEVQQIARDVSDVERIADDVRREILDLEDWNMGKGHYEPPDFKFQKYRSVLVNQVMPGFKGLLITFGAIRNRMDIVQKLIQKNSSEEER